MTATAPHATRLFALIAALALMQTGCTLREAAEAVEDIGGALVPGGLNPAGGEVCSDADLEEARQYMACLEAERAMRCAEAGLDAGRCLFELAMGEADATGCTPPTDIDPACGAALAPAARPDAGEPLDCAAAQRAVAAARGTYHDDPYEMLDVAHWQVLGSYEHGGTMGYTARYVEGGARACYVAFRGTDEFVEGLDNLRSVLHEQCGDLPGRCAVGFHAPYREAVASGIVDATIAMAESGECDTLTLTGHSLGGAIADIMAANLYFRDPALFARGFLDVQTFGQPRVFDGPHNRLADTLHAEVAKTRWMRWGDPVPGLPLVDFVHTGTARIIHEAFDWGRLGTQWTFATTHRNSSGEGFWPFNHLIAQYQESIGRCQ